MSSGDGVSKQNGTMAGSSVDTILTLPKQQCCFILAVNNFLLVCLRLRKDSVRANSEGLAETESILRFTGDEEGDRRLMS